MPPEALLRVVINAQLATDGRSGGIEQFVRGLVHSLGQLGEPDVDYVVVGPAAGAGDFAVELAPNQRLVRYRPPRRLLRRLARRSFFDALGADVVHFPYQGYVPSRAPTIFNPHDLQHLHHPEFFDADTIAQREALYRAACARATAVVAESDWGRTDLVRRYGLPPEKVVTVKRGAPTDLYAPVSADFVQEVARRHELPAVFALYPAQTWPHKNHLRLLEAVALLRDVHAARVDVVCTGTQNDFWPSIAHRLDELRLRDRVRFLGFRPPEELKALYRLATFVVLPSLFEGGGFPVVEAFHEDVPLAASSATCLPEYAGDAALVFDPESVESIADALLRMSSDEALRDGLRERGRRRAALFTWRRTADAYSALYRRVAAAGHR